MRISLARAPGIGAPLLQHHPDLRLEALAVGGRVETQDRHLAAGGAAETFEDLDGGGFARPVGSQERVRFARGHLEGDPVDGGQFAVALLETLNGDGRWHEARW